MQPVHVAAERAVERAAALARDVVALLEQIGDVAQRRERRPELVRDGGDELRLQAADRQLALHHAPEEVAAAGEEHEDGDERERELPAPAIEGFRLWQTCPRARPPPSRAGP